MKGTSSPHLGKLTKTRPAAETLTPVGIGPLSKLCTVSSSLMAAGYPTAMR